MDRDLLRGMFELIQEGGAGRNKPAPMWLEGIDALSSECVFMLCEFLRAHSDLKCIATSYTSLDSLLAKQDKEWRELLQRIGPLRIELPSFVSRMSDLRIVISAWLADHVSSGGRRLECSSQFIDSLMAYPWPGDIEEFSTAMRSVIEQAGETTTTLQTEHLPVAIRTTASFFEHSPSEESIDLDQVLEDIEKKLIQRAIERFPGNKTSAAKLLGISRSRLLRRLQQWGMIDPLDAAGDLDDRPIFKEVK